MNERHTKLFKRIFKSLMYKNNVETKTEHLKFGINLNVWKRKESIQNADHENT
jgi:hypothetical protein